MATNESDEIYACAYDNNKKAIVYEKFYRCFDVIFGETEMTLNKNIIKYLQNEWSDSLLNNVIIRNIDKLTVKSPIIQIKILIP